MCLQLVMCLNICVVHQNIFLENAVTSFTFLSSFAEVKFSLSAANKVHSGNGGIELICM